MIVARHLKQRLSLIISAPRIAFETGEKSQARDELACLGSILNRPSRSIVRTNSSHAHSGIAH